MEGENLPKQDAAIFRTPPCVLPRSSGEACVDDAAEVAVVVDLGSGQPGVHDQGGAGVELVRLGRGVAVVEGVEQGGRGDLGGLLGRGVAWAASHGAQRHHGQPIAVRHGGGGGLPRGSCGRWILGSRAPCLFCWDGLARAVSVGPGCCCLFPGEAHKMESADDRIWTLLCGEQEVFVRGRLAQQGSVRVRFGGRRFVLTKVSWLWRGGFCERDRKGFWRWRKKPGAG